MSRKITFLTLFLWLMTVTFPVIAQQNTDRPTLFVSSRRRHVLRALEWQ